MATLIVAASRFGRVFVSRAGINMKLTGSTNVNAKWKMFINKFEKDSEHILRKNGCALCHEMADVSLPQKHRGLYTANDGHKKFGDENQALAGVAFKSWDSKNGMFWALSPYSNVAQYVIKRSGYQFKSPIAQNLSNIGKFDLLRAFLLKKGLVPSPQIPKAQFVKDKADLPTFIHWKSNYKKGGQRGPYYVRDKASISRMAREKGLYNYASIVINGWLAASKALGDTPPASVKKVVWGWGQGIGSGNGSIVKKGQGMTTMTISNDNYNLNGIFNSRVQQAVWNKRQKEIDSEVTRFFRTMAMYWDSINPP